MQKKRERKVLAALLAVSMCMTCLPVGMGQVRAEEGTESAVELTEQMDVAPKPVQEPLADADEPVAAEVPDEDAAEVPEEMIEPEAVEVLEGEEAADPEETTAPDSDATEAPEEMAAPDSEAAEAPKEMEAEEESIHDYEASAESGANIVEEDREYTESPSSPQEYVFTPKESGVYCVEENGENWGDNVFECYSIADRERIDPFHITLGREYRNRLIWLEKGKDYRLDWTEVEGNGLTWQIFRLNPQKFTTGEEYTHKYDSHSCYTFTPAKSGKYKLFIYNNYRTQYEAYVIDNADNNISISFDSTISRRWIELIEGHTYTLFFTSMDPGDSASWTFEMQEQIIVGVDQDYTQTGEELKINQYLFTPAETGTYMIELKNTGQGDIWTNYFKSQKTGDLFTTNDLYVNGLQRHYVSLENNTTYEFSFLTYYLGIDSLSEIQCTWNIQKIQNISLELDKQYTHSTGDLICYEFTPKESGLYQLTYDKNVVYEIYKPDSDTSFTDEDWGDVGIPDYAYKFNGYYVCVLDKDVTYRIVIHKPNTSENEIDNYTMQMRMVPLEKIEKADKIYKKAKNEPAYYQFTADKTGWYLLEGIVGFGTTDMFYTNMVGWKGHLRNVSLKEGETITILVSGDVEEVCVRSEKRTSDGFVYVQQPDGTIAITGYNGDKKEVVMPDKIDGINVTAIGPYAFYKKSEVTSVQLPSTLKEIYRAAFCGCSALSNLTLPDTIERCVEDAFGYNDENYAAWYKNLPDGEVYIGKTLYEYKGTVPEGTKVTVKPGTVYVSDNAFEGQTGVSEVILPDGLKEIGSHAFACGKNLKSIVIPASVTEIGGKAVGYESELSQYGYYYEHNKLNDFVIYGQKGSAAEEYAIENGFEFVENVTLVRGDVDQSGKVDISDLRMMLRYVCGKVQLTDAQIQAGDVVGKTDAEASDGKVTIADLRKLLRFICGKLQTL